MNVSYFLSTYNFLFYDIADERGVSAYICCGKFVLMYVQLTEHPSRSVALLYVNCTVAIFGFVFLT
jgi:hypothetical protein